MPTFIEQHLSDIVAGLALLASVSANVIAEKARRSAARAEERSRIISKSEKRTESLVEIELKNAAVGNMLLVTARKIKLFHERPHLADKHPGEYKRLINNLNLMQELQAKRNYERQVAEEALDGESILLHEKALADVRRLRVSLENEVQKETKMFEVFLKEAQSEGNYYEK